MAVIMGQVGVGEEGVRMEVERVVVHPRYHRQDSGLLEYDLAVLKLSRPVPGAIPVCLPGAGAGAVEELVVTGWGNTQPGLAPARSSPTLQHLQVHRVGLVHCRALLGLPGLAPTSHMCVEGRRAGEGACRGDSGGGVVGRRGGAWVLEGVVSFGRGRCGSRSPLVLARLGEGGLAGWVNTVIVGEARP